MTKLRIKYYSWLGFNKLEKFCRRGKNYEDDGREDDAASRTKLLKGLKLLAAPSNGKMKESVN